MPCMARESMNIGMHGIQPGSFEDTAWDLAIATQSRSDMDPQLAVTLSRIYSAQHKYAVLSGGMLKAMYLRPPGQDLGAFLQTVSL
jgi:hypothetical protein